MKASGPALAHAVRVLLEGGLVAFPTETVYGLGADASDPAAVARIYQAKGRPSNHPVIVHVASVQEMAPWVRDVPPEAFALAEAFWPGPLTLILKRAATIPDAVSGGQDTIGIRCPSHPVAQALLTAFARARPGRPSGLAAPSANRFGRVSPTRAQHVRDEFADLVAAGMPVLEGGDSEVGIESTILDLSRLGAGGPPALLRPGGLSAESIESVLGCRLAGADAQAPRVSGSLKAHYAPHTALELCAAATLEQRIDGWLATHPGDLAVVVHSDRLANVARPRVHLIRLPHDARAYARRLYATLRAVDTMGVASVLWEAVPTEPAWDGVHDRLSRAAAAFDSGSA